MLNVKRINKNESYLAICENIKLYCMAEYGHDYDENEEIFNKDLICPIAFTNLGEDDQFDIQVSLDLKVLLQS